MGKETFGLLRALVAPTKLKDKTFGEQVETLRVHLAPKLLVIAERFRFYKRDQKETEGIKAYATSLQRLAEHCDFGDMLSDALRDRLVCGMRDGTVQKRLLGKADLTFAKAPEVAELEEIMQGMWHSCTKASQRTSTACRGHPDEGEIEMPLGHLLGLATAVGETTCQTNVSSGGSTVGFASYKVIPRGCAKRR